MIKRLRTGELDLAVIWDLPDAGDDMGEGLEVHHLFDDPWVLVLNPDHPLAGEERVAPIDLADEDWLMPSFMPDGASARTLARWAASHDFEPNIVFRVNDCQMTKAMVAANEGVSLIPRMMLDPPPAEVVVKKMEGKPIARRISAVRLPSRYLSPAAAAFLDATREAAKKREALQQA
jgi:DNA-binding transcriptional LysR family regulator